MKETFIWRSYRHEGNQGDWVRTTSKSDHFSQTGCSRDQFSQISLFLEERVFGKKRTTESGCQAIRLFADQDGCFFPPRLPCGG